MKTQNTSAECPRPIKITLTLIGVLLLIAAILPNTSGDTYHYQCPFIYRLGLAALGFFYVTIRPRA